MYDFLSHYKGEEAVIGDLEKLYKCRHKFVKYLTPKTSTVYKGIRWETNSKMLAKHKGRVKLNGFNGTLFYVYDLMYSPKHKIQEWTTNLLVAGGRSLGLDGNFLKNVYLSTLDRVYVNPTRKRLGVQKVDKLVVPTIIAAKTDDSFFGSHAFSQRIGDVTGINEDMVFRLGKQVRARFYVPERFANMFL